MDLEKNPLSSRTAIRRTPAPLRRATSPASHASAPRAVRVARLVHGHVSDLEEGGFDAATCFNVMHFLPDDGAKQSLLRDIARCLAPGAPFLLFELHGDRDGPRFDELFTAWSRYWEIHGMQEAERAAFRAKIDEGIHWASEARILELLAGARFEDAWRYYRALLYGAWISRRAR